jgi:hypothetical protein
MSTILKTLRKLEEEKNILDQKLDLKGMLLKEDTAYPKSIKSERLKFFLLMTMVAGLLIAGGAVFSYWPSSQEVSSSRKHVLNKTPVQQPPPFKDLSRLRAFEGVPMAAISSNELASKPKPNKYLSSKQVAKLLPEEAPPISTSSGMEEIESLIRSTTALAKKNPLCCLQFKVGVFQVSRLRESYFLIRTAHPTTLLRPQKAIVM